MSEIWSKMYVGLHVKYRLLLSAHNATWILWTDFRKILKYQISCKILSGGAGLLNADRQTDMAKLTMIDDQLTLKIQGNSVLQPQFGLLYWQIKRAVETQRSRFLYQLSRSTNSARFMETQLWHQTATNIRCEPRYFNPHTLQFF